MYKGKNILGLIPARGGSKGLPRKNIIPLLGKPLIAWTIEQALASKYLDRVVVSTDDKEIAGISKKYGAEVPFIRPKHLATDTATSLSVLQHAANYLSEKEGYLADIIVCLQPTSPLCSAEDIDKAITLCISTGADSVVSLCQVEHHPYWMKKVVEGKVYPLMEVDDEKYPRRQDLPPVYQLNGAIYVTRRKVLMEEEKVLGEHTLAYIMPQERSVDIDTPIDLKLAELAMKGEAAL